MGAMQKITKQSVLKVFQEEIEIALDDFTDKDMFFDIGPEVKDQKTSDFTKVVCAQLRLSPICCQQCYFSLRVNEIFTISPLSVAESLIVLSDLSTILYLL